MRKPIIALLGLLCLGVAYLSTPFFTVWKIREAMQNGDAHYLDAKIEWVTVRETLRSSLTRLALNIPEGINPAPEPRAKPGIWQRIKNGLSQRAVDSVIETYVTPEGLPQLFSARQFYRESISGDAAAQAALPWYVRAKNFWSRVKRAEFKSPLLFEIEMADRNNPGRHYIGLLALRGLEWKLTELHLRVITGA